MEQPFEFDGKTMNAPVTAPNGVINAETIFQFEQEGELITAEYAGGGVKMGYLIGKMVGGKFEFQYTQMDQSGRLDGGHSLCDLEQTEDGRIRIIEHFEWSTQEGKGTNVIEELPD